MARLATTGVRLAPPGRILGLVVLMTPLSGAGIDIYVPSLPSMTEYFNTTPALIQLTITMYLLGYGTAQLVVGAASEVLGRRPVVIVGSLVYAAMALAVALAPSVTALLAFRLLQGMALSATATLNRSILTDTFSGAELAKASNAMTLAWALGPIVAPVLGAWLHERFGWQSCFWFLMAYGLVLFVLLLTSLPETIAHRRALDVAAIVRELGSFLKDHVFVAAALVLALMYSYIAVFSMVAPFLVQVVLRYPAATYGWIGLGMGVWWFAGNSVNRMLLGDSRRHQLAVTGVFLLAILAPLSMLVLSLVVPLSLTLIVAPSALLFFSGGLLFPNLFTVAMSRSGGSAGIASAVLGTLFILGTSLVSAMVSRTSPHSVQPLAATLLVLAVLAGTLYRSLVRRALGALEAPAHLHGHP
jgi:MFS transporter, DHA1 family, multidrug resistance protein